MFKVSRFLNRNFLKNLSPHFDHNIYHSFPSAHRGLANEAVASNSYDSNLKQKEEEDKEITPHTNSDQLESLADYLNSNVDYSSTSKQQLKSPAYKKLDSTSQPTTAVYESLINKITTSSSTFDESRKFAEKVLSERLNYHEIVNKGSRQKNKLSSHFDMNMTTTTSEYADNEEEIKSYVPPLKFSNKTNNDEDYSNRSKSNKIIESKNLKNLKDQSKFANNEEPIKSYASIAEKTNGNSLPHLKRDSIFKKTNNNEDNTKRSKSKKSDRIIASQKETLEEESDSLAKFDDSNLEISNNEQLNAEVNEKPLTDEEQMKLDIKNLRPAYRPLVYNLAYFVNTNKVLENFVKMGIEIRKWDKSRTIAESILRLDEEKHVKPILIFLHDIGIPKETQAFVIEKNPMLFSQEMTNLNARIEYLKSKKFSNEMITSIVVKAPLILNISVSDVDTKLGWFQSEFKLTGNEIRTLMTDKPRLITLPLNIPSKVKFSLKEFLCYDEKTIKNFLLTFPKMFTKEFEQIEANIVYLTQVCKLTDTFIAMYPPILCAPLHLLKSRYAYLKHLDRVQFDPTKPNFVSLKNLIEPNLNEFCRKTAKTTVDDFTNFLKKV